MQEALEQKKAALRPLLTPEQFAIYEQHLAFEQATTEELMNSLTNSAGGGFHFSTFSSSP